MILERDQRRVNKNEEQYRHGSALPQQYIQPLADIFKVLGDPTRLRILHALMEGELCVRYRWVSLLCPINCEFCAMPVSSNFAEMAR